MGIGVETRLVRKNKDEKSTTVGDTVYILNEAGKGLVKGVIAVMAAWVVLDTARQVTIDASHHKVYYKEETNGKA